MILFNEEANGVLALGLCPPEECQAVVDEIKNLEGWEDAQVRVQEDEGLFDRVVRGVRIASVLPLARSPRLSRQIHRKLATVVKPLIAQFWGVELREHGGLQLVRYSAGGYYDAHCDASMEFGDRYFTLLCYLNDDFEGGRTEFPHLNHAAVPVRGKAIVFPATYFHRAEPVMRGEKYVLVGWVLGPVPVKWI
jgi:predicted 2-oxoglutarate/Fe(II)-dependent dioxygenase YbiX